MADAPRDFDLPEAVAASKRRWSLSIVWAIPIVAALAGGWLAFKAINEQGPTITITFKTAEGLEAGKTKIKYKNVEDRKSTRLNSSHGYISYAVFCLKKKKINKVIHPVRNVRINKQTIGGKMRPIRKKRTILYCGVCIRV